MHLNLTILSFPGHNDKPNLVKYHPVASGVLASSSLDLTVKIWDINKAKALITLTGHSEQVRKSKVKSCVLQKKTADISRCHYWFPYKMTSEKQAQCF